ncbi:murein L,D-transpeptidase catalytic domain-containing protein [Paraflavitalea pollutisoli]|uniref:murein L,D-transpeptidase catalytic domain-containing protein n=1 Tax=Paraflavitalea pollutisoli TaxID=3034143 RepID=UPI0023EC6D39|nr:murein L,D-transpeptidase catalytic domain family protein [Paraflavitalea sp. H1-2-19X]
MKRIVVRSIAFLLLLLLIAGGWYYYKMKSPPANTPGRLAALNSDAGLLVKLSSRARQARQFAALKKYNTTVCFLIDMSIPSGSNRIFVYNLVKDSLLDAGLVTEGSCSKGNRFGNEVGCGCTSLGKYKIGSAYQGKFGLAYKLHGLDQTNSNAFKRFVVLHSHDCVPASEVDPYPICRSEGCPTVAPYFLQKLAATIDGSSRPVLLWIFE